MVRRFRRELSDRLPLPLAQLYLRACNAKSPRDCHDNAFYLFEAAIKLAAATQVAVYRAHGTPDPTVDISLADLSRPALGHWIRWLHAIAALTATYTPHPFPAVGSVSEAMSVMRKDLPAIQALMVAMAERVAGVPRFSRDKRRLRFWDLLEALGTYRNQMSTGHAAVRLDAFYNEMAERLFAAVEETFAESMLFGQAELVYVEEVRETGDRREIGILTLMGTDPLRGILTVDEMEPVEVKLQVGRLHWRDENRILVLPPLVIWDSEMAAMLFLNEFQVDKRIEYLNYATGETTVKSEFMTKYGAELENIVCYSSISATNENKQADSNPDSTRQSASLSEPHTRPVTSWRDVALRPGVFVMLLLASFTLWTIFGRRQVEDTTQNNVYPVLLHSTAYVQTSSGSGTAWILDTKRKLLVTNYHVTLNPERSQVHDEVVVMFPAYREGKVIAERQYYAEHQQHLLEQGRAVRARVLDVAPKRDLAVLVADTLPEDVTAVTLASESPHPADRLHSIGNPGASDALWLYSAGVVKQVARKMWRVPLGTDVIHLDARVVETQAPTNHGDSGGPVVNDRGELVAVTQGGTGNASLLNFAIDVTEVRDYTTSIAWMTQARTAEDYYRRARHYWEDTTPARRDLALADVNEAIRLKPNQAESYILRAEINTGMMPFIMKLSTFGRDNSASAERERGRQLASAAIGDCNIALSLGQSAAALVCRAKVYQRRAAYGDLRSDKYLELRDEDHAVVDYKEALRVDPNFIPAYTGLAALYQFKKSSLTTELYTNLAIEYYSKAIQLQPKSMGWLLIQRGELYERKKDYGQAIADYNAAIGYEPANVVAYRLRASLYQQQQEYTKAVEDYRTAIGLEPEQIYNWQQLAEVFAAWQRYDEAVEAYTEALQRVPYVAQPYQSTQAAQLLEARGDVLVSKGARESARDDYQQAMKLNSLRAEDIKRKLQAIDATGSEDAPSS